MGSPKPHMRNFLYVISGSGTDIFSDGPFVSWHTYIRLDGKPCLLGADENGSDHVPEEGGAAFMCVRVQAK
jgi:hypothetical protein